MNANKWFPQPVLSLLAVTARAVLSFSALSVAALFLLAAASSNAPAEEDASAPSAAFAVATANPAADSKVRFAGGSPREGHSWFWDFGDGFTSSSANPVHTYAGPGEFPVTLTVTTPRGTATASRILSVTAANTLRLLGAHPFDITLTATDPRTGATGGPGHFSERHLRDLQHPGDHRQRRQPRGHRQDGGRDRDRPELLGLLRCPDGPALHALGAGSGHGNDEDLQRRHDRHDGLRQIRHVRVRAFAPGS